MAGLPRTAGCRRCLVPEALRTVCSGVIPSSLAYHLNLPPGSRFETQGSALVDVVNYHEDRLLLHHLTGLAGPTLTSRRFDVKALAFPRGVVAPLDFARLPLHTRTRNCLLRDGLITADVLQRQSLEDLLAIRG